MSNYNLEYRKYYEGLKKNSRQSGYNSKNEEYLPISSMYNKNKVNNSNKISSTIINVITMQLVATLILSLLLFGAKYSSDVKLEKYYDSFKASIGKEYSFDELQEDIKAVNTNNIVDSVKNSVEWLKEKVETNPFNY